jgi:hypothetical protein
VYLHGLLQTHMSYFGWVSGHKEEREAAEEVFVGEFAMGMAASY